MDEEAFKIFIKETKNPFWHSSTIGIIGVLGVPFFGEVTNIYPPLFDYLWAASWGFILGGMWQHIYNEKDKEISDKLDKKISDINKKG